MIHTFGPFSYKYNDNNISREFIGGEYDETNIILKHFKIRHDDVFIDIGAHIGTWTLAALAMGASHVFAFDPYKEMLEHLKRNVELNGWSEKVTAVSKGISSQKMDDMLYKFDSDSTRELYNVQFDTLDSYDFARIDWIKIDIEGGELAALRGAVNTIQKHMPRMVIEIHETRIRELIPTFQPYQIIEWLPWIDGMSTFQMDSGHAFIDFGFRLLPPSIP